MRLLDDGKAKIADAKKKLTEASGFDTEEARRNIEEVKKGLSKLGKQLVDGGERLVSSPTDGSSENENPDASNCSSEESSFAAASADDTASCNSKERGDLEDGVNEEIQAIEERLAQLKSKRKKRGKSNKSSSTNVDSTTSSDPKNKEKSAKDSKGIYISKDALVVVACFALLLLIVLLSLGMSRCSSQTPVDSESNGASMAAEEQHGSTADNLAASEVAVELECDENWLLSRYDVDVFVDEDLVGNLDHGKADVFVIHAVPGKHKLRVQSEEDSSVDGSISFDTSDYSEFRFKIHCSSDQIEVTECKHVYAPMASSEAIGNSANDVELSFKGAGFDDIEVKEDASLTVSEANLAGTVKSITINEEEDFHEGDSYYSDASVAIVYFAIGDIHPPRSDDDYQGMSLGAVEDELRESGFTNIAVVDSDDASVSEDSVVDRVEIGLLGFLGFSETDSYASDEEVRIYLADSEHDEMESSSEEEPANLTPDTCADLATLLAQGDTDAGWFSSRYYGQAIEFDAAVWSVERAEGYRYLWNILLLAGDYETGGTRGPNFRFTEETVTESWCEDGRLSVGENVHVVARVGRYDSKRDWLELDPIEVTKR